MFIEKLLKCNARRDTRINFKHHTRASLTCGCVYVCAFTAMHTTLTSATLAHTDTHTYEPMPFIAHWEPPHSNEQQSAEAEGTRNGGSKSAIVRPGSLCARVRVCNK